MTAFLVIAALLIGYCIGRLTEIRYTRRELKG